MAKLTAKQQRFVEEYLIDLNATQAAIRAGYSPKTANEQGARLLANASVQEAIAKAMAERSRRTGISQDRVIQELARIAFVNPKNVIDFEDASVRPDVTEDDLACIQSVKVKTTDGPKGTSMEQLGKHLGMFTEKVDVAADMDLNITIDYGDGDSG